MFTFEVCIVLVGCVIATNAHCWKTYGYHHGCGLDSGESMCSASGLFGYGTGKTCEPLVVRPQEILKPKVTEPLTPVPGPCACKKAIVKPALLPRPVCTAGAHHKGYGCGGAICGGCTSCGGCACNQKALIASTTTHLLEDCYNRDRIISTCDSGLGIWAPADAVSIAIAQQNADQLCTLDEDRLAFGFRKIPIEVPRQKIIRQNNIPEEKIFSLNGQIVELKPVKVCCSDKTIDEEAAEDLLALEEEEETASVDECSPIKKISLGELGYVPAKIPRKTFVDIEESASEDSATPATEDLDECGCGVSASAAAAASEAADSSGYRAGKVVYKTVPKPSLALAIAAVDETTDCDSGEVGEEQTVMYDEELDGISKPYGVRACGCAAVAPCGCAAPCSCAAPCGCPRVYHSCSSSSSSSSTSTKKKKASLIIQKLCNSS